MIPEFIVTHEVWLRLGLRIIGVVLIVVAYFRPHIKRDAEAHAGSSFLVPGNKRFQAIADRLYGGTGDLSPLEEVSSADKEFDK